MEESEKLVEDTKKTSFSVKVKNYFKNLVDFSSYSRKTIVFIIVIIIILGISFYLLYLWIFVDNKILYRFVVEWFDKPPPLHLE